MYQSLKEISIKGQWVKVPAIAVKDGAIVVTGRWIKMASIHDEEWMEQEIKQPDLCVATLKDTPLLKRVADIFTFTQKPSSIGHKYSYPAELESIAAIQLSSFQEWWEALPQESRKNVRRSQKRGVVIKVSAFDDALIEGIIGINNDSPIRQGRRYTHFGKSFEQVKRDHQAFVERSDFICAYHEGEMIGFLKIVYRGEVASILQLTPKASHSDKRPANAMLAKAIELSAARGIRCVTYGLFNYGNKGDTPIREFKKRNGFTEVLVPRYYVPLTPWGQLCVRFKLHRGLVGILPRTVLDFLVSTRAKINESRLSRKKEAGVAQC
jgi:hypothetical protein